MLKLLIILRRFYLWSFFVTLETSSKFKILSNFYNFQKFVLIYKKLILNHRKPSKIKSFSTKIDTFLSILCMLYVWNKSWDCWDLLATSRSVFFGKNVSCYCLQFLQNKYGGFKQFQKFQANLSNFILTRSDVRRKKLKIKKGLYECYLVTANQTNRKSNITSIRNDLGSI